VEDHRDDWPAHSSARLDQWGGRCLLSLNSDMQSGSCSRHTHHQALSGRDRFKISSPIERVRSVIQRIDDDEPPARSVRGRANHLKGIGKKART
jgi:hypothetical protein